MPAAWLSDELERHIDSSEFKHSHWRQDTSRLLSRKKLIPPWTKSDQKIQALLICVFPKLNQNVRQRKAAGRWAYVIYGYYRAGLTCSEIGRDLRISDNAVHEISKSIRRTAAGKTARGLPRGIRRRGRPMKMLTP